MPTNPSVIQLSTLNGTNGFQINGIDGGDRSGFSVASAGDVNGDGFDDLVIGAYGANGAAGESYVVFGKAGGRCRVSQPVQPQWCKRFPDQRH